MTAFLIPHLEQRTGWTRNSAPKLIGSYFHFSWLFRSHCKSEYDLHNSVIDPPHPRLTHRSMIARDDVATCYVNIGRWCGYGVCVPRRAYIAITSCAKLISVMSRIEEIWVIGMCRALASILDTLSESRSPSLTFLPAFIISPALRRKPASGDSNKAYVQAEILL